MAVDLDVAALTAFLAARLDEDEHIARMAAREGGTWTQDDPERRPGAISSLGGPVVYDEGAPDENQAPHIARHNPARVLRDVGARRAILAECLAFREEADRVRAELGTVGGGLWTGTRELDWAVKRFAAVYSDHPDYRPVWKP